MPHLTAACSIDLRCSRVQPLPTSQCSQKPQLHIVGLSHGMIYTQFSSICLHSWRYVMLHDACAMPKPIHFPPKRSPNRWLVCPSQQSLLRRGESPPGKGRECFMQATGRHTLGTHSYSNAQKASIEVCLCPKRSLWTYSAKHSMLGAHLPS